MTQYIIAPEAIQDLFYRLSQDTIEIMRVVRGNRDLEALFNTDQKD
ncbi:hypothetical protein VB715_15525 [Crocosphaera sp. UHCC 0190]|nr:hypothetical protein [Crocosphaera sp. UHCC 0190]MEA5511184.1 hypothetical protein [Crocosphaera sp. UHCC 0190]